MNPTKDNPLVITAGSGPSYSGWKFWPTWTKMLPLYMQCLVQDVSGPAAGNKFIARSVITALANATPDTVIVQWNLGKFDLYITDPIFIDLIINSSSERNFIVDPLTQGTTNGAGYWCSSHDDTIEWKRYYNRHVRNPIGSYLDDLEQMINLQNICQRKGIEYGFVTHDAVDHQWLQQHPLLEPFYREIEWHCAMTDSSVSDLYRDHPSHLIHTVPPGHGRGVPGPEWQYWFLDSVVGPWLSDRGYQRRPRCRELGNHCATIAQKLQQRYPQCDY